MKIQGEAMTMQNALQLKKAGQSAIDAGDSEFDLSEVKTVDSSAVSVLLSWIRHAKKKAISLRIRRVPVALDSLLSLYGIHALLEPFIFDKN